jgi:hypothetical protein
LSTFLWINKYPNQNNYCTENHMDFSGFGTKPLLIRSDLACAAEFAHWTSDVQVQYHHRCTWLYFFSFGSPFLINGYIADPIRFYNRECIQILIWDTAFIDELESMKKYMVITHFISLGAFQKLVVNNSYLQRK